MNPVSGLISSLKRKAVALVPAPCLFVLTDAAQPDLVRQLPACEAEEPSPQALALIGRCDHELVEVESREVQGQHAGDGPAIIGDKQTPAVLDLPTQPRAQVAQQAVTGLREP